MDSFVYFNFLLAAVALLASPGPAYATVVTIGRSAGWKAGQIFNIGLQVGMGIVALLTAFGMAAVIFLHPGVKATLGLIGITYLLFLAFKIATSPVHSSTQPQTIPTSFWMGVLVGVTNPKAYIAQSSLFATFHLLPASPMLDGGVKWASAVVIMTIAGLGWLWLGAKLGEIPFNAKAERGLNIFFAVAILLAGGATVIL